MKRLIPSMICIILLVSICACHNYGVKPDDISNAHYEFGKKALDIVDQYMDGRISAETARDRLDHLYNYGDHDLPETEFGDPMHRKNFSVEGTVWFLKIEMSSIAFGTGSESELLDKRNDLAEDLNEKLR